MATRITSLHQLTPALQTKSGVLLANAICATQSTTRGQLVTLLSTNRPLPFPLRSDIVCCDNTAPTPSNQPVKTYNPAASSHVSPCAPQLCHLNITTAIKGNPQSSTAGRTVQRRNTLCLYTVNNTNTLTTTRIHSYHIVTFSSLNYRTVGRLRMRSFPLFITRSYRNNDLFH